MDGCDRISVIALLKFENILNVQCTPHNKSFLIELFVQFEITINKLSSHNFT